MELEFDQVKCFQFVMVKNPRNRNQVPWSNAQIQATEAIRSHRILVDWQKVWPVLLQNHFRKIQDSVGVWRLVELFSQVERLVTLTKIDYLFRVKNENGTLNLRKYFLFLTIVAKNRQKRILGIRCQALKCWGFWHSASKAIIQRSSKT